MIQLSVKEAMDIASEISMCNYVVAKSLDEIIELLYGGENNLGGVCGNLGESQVRDMLETIAQKSGAIRDFIADDSRQLDSFVQMQFGSYIDNAKRLQSQYESVINEAKQIAEEIRSISMSGDVGIDPLPERPEFLGYSFDVKG